MRIYLFFHCTIIFFFFISKISKIVNIRNTCATNCVKKTITKIIYNFNDYKWEILTHWKKMLFIESRNTFFQIKLTIIFFSSIFTFNTKKEYKYTFLLSKFCPDLVNVAKVVKQSNRKLFVKSNLHRKLKQRPTSSN